ncbi:hypothetical protein [Chiayiivirga flava]|uniref:Uncharacterized protein n=1 Tax=Chiayiivirga flava TaxID=659595 RepID=A0A7W8D4Z4_9GAMM|nr:hypothetical protein [Chiayiivirga flava]MBB5208019.1 hypothetical protein [Chiayiivirga flava]
MDARQVIETYVTDVALLLPRRQRNDVAFELRALLGEELQALADAAGRPPDAEMALALARGMGRPADVAARYRPAVTIIDPADGAAFRRAAWIGLVVIWGLGLLRSFWPPLPESGVLGALGHWWTTAALPSLWWPGVLVAGFAAAAWGRRRWPRTADWMPRPSDAAGNRGLLVVAAVAALCGACVLVAPAYFIDAALGGRAAPVVIESFTYTETFRQRQGIVLLVLLFAQVALMAVAIVQGRRPPLLRRAETALALLFCAAMAWTIASGPIFLGAESDRTAKSLLIPILVCTLIGIGLQWYRRVRPAPG